MTSSSAPRRMRWRICIERFCVAETVMVRSVDFDTGASAYFELPAEKLVLEGYRCWTRGFFMRSTEPWTEAQLLYRSLLGDDDAFQAIVALAGFIKTLGQCAACPLRMFHSGAPQICRDETLVMGLISGIQNCDEAATTFCLERLCCLKRRSEAGLAAGDFALTLKAMRMVMRPIPAPVLVSVVDRPPGHPAEARFSRTLH